MAENKEILEKLDVVIKLLSRVVTADKNKTDSIVLLNEIGLDNQTIETITKANAQTVRNRISEAKKKRVK